MTLRTARWLCIAALACCTALAAEPIRFSALDGVAPAPRSNPHDTRNEPLCEEPAAPAATPGEAALRKAGWLFFREALVQGDTRLVYAAGSMQGACLPHDITLFVVRGGRLVGRIDGSEPRAEFSARFEGEDALVVEVKFRQPADPNCCPSGSASARIPLGASAGAGAGAASFDCGKASTPVEKAICGDAELSRLDGQMGAAFREARARAADPAAVLADQRAWIAQRNAQCGADVPCLTRLSGQRIASLTSVDLGGAMASSEGNRQAAAPAAPSAAPSSSAGPWWEPIENHYPKQEAWMWEVGRCDFFAGVLTLQLASAPQGVLKDLHRLSEQFAMGFALALRDRYARRPDQRALWDQISQASADRVLAEQKSVLISRGAEAEARWMMDSMIQCMDPGTPIGEGFYRWRNTQ